MHHLCKHTHTHSQAYIHIYECIRIHINILRILRIADNYLFQYSCANKHILQYSFNFIFCENHVKLGVGY